MTTVTPGANAPAPAEPLIATLRRVFRRGATDLIDPAPHLPPEEAAKLYGATFADMRNPILREPFVEGDSYVFEVEKPKVETKG